MQAMPPVLSRVFGKLLIESRLLVERTPKPIFLNWFIAGFKIRKEVGSLFLIILMMIASFRRHRQSAWMEQNITHMAYWSTHYPHISP
jgi:uncharacterized membrane protein